VKLLAAILFLSAAILIAGESQAQTGFAASELNRLQTVANPATYSANRIRNSSMTAALPRSGLGQFTTGAASNAFGRANKPFSSISKGPSVTPYLALDNPFTSPATSYYTQIRPQMEQQRINQQQERQNQLMQRQISQYTALQPYDPTGSDARAPTGHASVYMNYGGYYSTPAPGGSKRR
jgi:hypothetical protein